jgi:hypothetical protein
MTNGKDSYIKYKMRYCEDNDYLRHGISIESVHKLTERLCPDLGDDYEN